MSNYILLAALVTTTAEALMFKMADGSFMPWSRLAIERRAASAGLPLALTNHNDQSYLSTVLMGTPFQEIDMSPSLSQNFISVASAPLGVSSNTYYNSAASSSYSTENGVASLPSISGQTITASYGHETCELQYTNSQQWAYNASIVLTNDTVSNDLYPVGARGVLGYGINGPTTPANASLIPVFLPANFTQAVCGIELNHKDDPVPDGIFTMGAVDPTAFTGSFTNATVPSDSPVSWSVPFDSITFPSNGANQSLPGILASIDLYHSVIQVTTAMATQLYGGIPGSQAVSNSNAWSIPCNSVFPITLTFTGVPFTISERDTVVQQSDGTCQGVVTGGAQTVGKVGAPFMRNFYTQFGAIKSANGSLTAFVGFATKIQRSAPATTTVVSATTVTATVIPTNQNGASGIVAVQGALLLSALSMIVPIIVTLIL